MEENGERETGKGGEREREREREREGERERGALDDSIYLLTLVHMNAIFGIT